MKDKKKKAFNRQEQVELKPEPIKNQTTIPIHSYWFFSIMVIIASSMFVNHNATDIQMYDTTYAIAFHHLVVAISVLLLAYGFIYWSQRNNPLTKWMTNFHSLLTMVIIGTFYMTCFQESTWNITPVLMFGIILFLVAQVILTLNIVLAKK